MELSGLSLSLVVPLQPDDNDDDEEEGEEAYKEADDDEDEEESEEEAETEEVEEESIILMELGPNGGTIDVALLHAGVKRHGSPPSRAQYIYSPRTLRRTASPLSRMR